MMGMIVTASDPINIGETLGSDHPFGKASMGLVCIRILHGQRVRKIWVEQNSFPSGIEQKTALSKPPKPRSSAGARVGDLSQQNIVFLKSGLHANRAI